MTKLSILIIVSTICLGSINAIADAFDDDLEVFNYSVRESQTQTREGAQPNRITTDDLSSFKKMLEETGCGSLYSPRKQEDLFANNWHGKPMVLRGNIRSFSDNWIELKVLDASLISDVWVEMKDPNGTYDLKKEQSVTVQFIIDKPSGCIANLYGRLGVVQ